MLCDSIEAVNFYEVLSLSGAHLCDSCSCELRVHVQPVQEVSGRSLAVCVARGVAEEAKSQGLLLRLISWVEWLESLVTECSPPVVNGRADDRGIEILESLVHGGFRVAGIEML